MDIFLDFVGIVKCKLPFMPTLVHLKILVLALGGTIPEFCDHVRHIAGDRYDPDSFRGFELAMQEDHLDIINTQKAILFISGLHGRAITSTGLNVLRNEVFPHLNSPSSGDDKLNFQRKTEYFALCVVQLVLHRGGKIQSDLRDDWALNQVVTSSHHLGSLFRLLFIAHVRTCGKMFRRYIMKTTSSSTVQVDITKIYGEHRLTARVIGAVASGAWSTIRKGVSISVTGSSYDAIESQLRRVSSSLVTTDGSHTVPRNVTNDQYGFICAASTPDGESTGLIYELGLTATLSPPIWHPEYIEEILDAACSSLIKTPGQTGGAQTFAVIYPTGRWGCSTTQPENFIARVLHLRRTGSLSSFVFLSIDHARRTIHIRAEEGIVCRPLLICDALHKYKGILPGTTLSRLLIDGIVEYVSPAEQTTLCVIALSLDSVTPRSTHVEITQASFLGAMASTVPFATGQQGPRLAYYTSQIKQIISPEIKRQRGATGSNQLWYPHRPLVRTQVAEVAPPPGLSACRGIPLVIAMMALPDNQEDGIIMKRTIFERGAFVASSTREYVSETLTPNATTQDRFERPPDTICRKNISYDHIQKDGLPSVRSYIPGGGVVVAKTKSVRRASVSTNSNEMVFTKCDVSTLSRRDEGGVVKSTMIAQMQKGRRATVCVETTRQSDVGDKFTSRYAQKGVLGGIWNEEDMPFSTQTGLSPDVIVSPLGMTSRMTMSALLELLVGKGVCVSGDISLGIDDQNYEQSNRILQQKFEKILVEHGFSGCGTEQYVDGRTGEIIKARVLTGVVEYNRLVHLSSKKLHSRATGPKDPLTRQPVDGRRSGGGLRTGEMESAAMSAHGAAFMLQERFRELSDAFEICVCGTCGLLSDDICSEINYAFCRGCHSDTSVRSVMVPFTFLVMSLELLSTGISTHFHLKDEEGLIHDLSVVDHDMELEE
jgi:DNA-directed RNA polymerase beta subunit